MPLPRLDRPLIMTIGFSNRSSTLSAPLHTSRQGPAASSPEMAIVQELSGSLRITRKSRFPRRHCRRRNRLPRGGRQTAVLQSDAATNTAAFLRLDMLWLDGRELQAAVAHPRALAAWDHAFPTVLAAIGEACPGPRCRLVQRSQDLEGVVAKLAGGRYDPDATSWVKIKNRGYSQAEGRHDFFDARRRRLADFATVGAAR